MKKKGILSVFKSKKPIIAMIHLKGDTPEDIFERAKKEITIFEENGVDGIMLENYYGNYYDLERILEYVSKANLSIPYGVNCLNVDTMGFELATKYNASYIQVDSVVGHVKPRDEATLEEFLNYNVQNAQRI